MVGANSPQERINAMDHVEDVEHDELCAFGGILEYEQMSQAHTGISHGVEQVIWNSRPGRGHRRWWCPLESLDGQRRHSGEDGHLVPVGQGIFVG